MYGDVRERRPDSFVVKLDLLADATDLEKLTEGRPRTGWQMGFRLSKAEISTLPQRPECGKRQYCTARDDDLPE